jgi:hypothetical protein
VRCPEPFKAQGYFFSPLAKCIFFKMDLYRYKCDACDFTLDWAETGHYFVIDYTGQYHICNHFRPYRDISYVLNIEEEMLMKALWSQNKDPKSISIHAIVNERYGTFSCYFCHCCHKICEIDDKREQRVCKYCGSRHIVPPNFLEQKPCPSCKRGVFKNNLTGIV